jgi:hypothetical protein
MTRLTFIERVRRQIYNGLPPQDATITIGLVNNYLNDAIALAAKQNYKENIAVDGISYINNSFYTTFKGIAVTKDENFLWKIQLPQIPLGIGTSEGISTVEFKDTATGQISYPAVWLSENQRSYQKGMRQIPNKVLAYSQGEFVFALSTIILSQYTATITMVSGGSDTNLQSTLNVPDDYFGVMMQYLQSQLLLEKAQPVDVTNDGIDIPSKTT